MAALTVKYASACAKETPKDLKSLMVSNKNLERIDDIRECRNLERLDVSKNNIVTADGLGHCLNLKWLNISKNNLCSLGFAAGLSAMSVLNAGYNEIEETGPVRNLINLNALILNNNKISMPSGLNKLKFLNTLVLSHNAIREIDVTSLVALTKLQLSHNVLSKFPDIQYNKELKSLSLNDNEISRVPEECLGQTRLESLDLGKNQIKKFKHVSSLCVVDSLRKLNFKGNPLEENDNYTKKILHLFPKVENLDTKQITTDSGKRKRKHQDEENGSPKKKYKDQHTLDTSVSDEASKEPGELLIEHEKGDSYISTKSLQDTQMSPKKDKEAHIQKKLKQAKKKLSEKKDIHTNHNGEPSSDNNESQPRVSDSQEGKTNNKNLPKPISAEKKKKVKPSESGVISVKDLSKKRKKIKSVSDTPINTVLSSLHSELGSGLASSW